MGAALHVPEFLQKSGLSNFDGDAFDFSLDSLALAHKVQP
jgi:hypothetical protein